MAENFGMTANGKQGRWYVEVEEYMDDEEFVLIIAPFGGADERRFPPVTDAVKDIDDLINALQQARKDLVD